MRCGASALPAQSSAIGNNRRTEIKEGYLGDLLLVNGDPLTDVAALLDAQRLAMIMKDGHIYKMGKPLNAALGDHLSSDASIAR